MEVMIMKVKPRPLIAKISRERILQLSNDLSENMRTGTTEEWRAVALYFRGELDALVIVANQLPWEAISAGIKASEKLRNHLTRDDKKPHAARRQQIRLKTLAGVRRA